MYESYDMSGLLVIHDEYLEGKINLAEAIGKAQVVIDLSEASLREIFIGIERNNVVQLNSVKK